MKQFIACLCTSALLAFGTVASAAPTGTVTQVANKAEGTSYDQAYDYLVNFVGINPAIVVPVLLGAPVVTAQQQYVHDLAARLGYEFPVAPAG